MNKQASELQFMLIPLISRALTFLFFCFAQSMALAQEPMTLSRALNQTLQFNPALQLYPYTVRMSEAAQLQAATRPCPTSSHSAGGKPKVKTGINDRTSRKFRLYTDGIKYRYRC